MAEQGYLAAIVDSSQDAIISKSLSGVIVSWNGAAEKIFGYAAAEMIGRHISLLFPPDRLREEDVILERISRGDRVQHFETVRRRKDGSDFPVSLTISPIRDEGGAIIGVSKIVRDITEQRAAEVALRKTGARLRHVIEASPSALVMTDAAGIMELVNEQTERMFGYSRPELLGQAVELLLPERFRTGHPDLRQAFRRDLRARSMGTGRDLFGRRKDGREFPIEVGLNPIEMDGNALVLSAILDLTERKHAEEAIRRSEDRFRSIFGGVDEGIFIVDPRTALIVDVNAPGAAMFGYTPAEMVGLPIDSLSANDATHQPRTPDRIAEAIAGRQALRFDGRAKKKDGRLFWLEVCFQYMTISGEDVILSTVRDVTEKRSIDDQLRQAQKMEAVGQLTGGIAHDFNNLLAIIQGNLEFVGERTIGDADCREMIDDALVAVKRGADLTHQLLAYSRRQPLDPELVDLEELIGDFVKLLRRTLGEAIDIKQITPAGLWKTYVDPHQLQNALLNLALNARDAMPEGGKLIVEAANTIVDDSYAEQNIDLAPGPYVQISVADNGSGMSGDVVDRVVEPFFTTKPVGKGSGLGLSMVYGFVKQSGGHLKIYSEVDRGTRINLYLPRLAREAATVALSHGDIDSASLRGTETILVIEDDALVRKLAVRALSGLGYRVIEAEDGRAALRRIVDTPPIDLLLTDVVLPNGLSGPDIAAMLQEVQPNVRILYMSGYTKDIAIGTDDRGDSINLLSKPFPRDELARKVRDVLTDEVRK
jgi:PAS domain S-box-containing protein